MAAKAQPGKTNVVIKRIWYFVLKASNGLCEKATALLTAQEVTNAGGNPANYSLDPTGSYMVDGNNNRIQAADGIADNPYGQTFDQLDRVYDPGTTLNNFVSVSQ
ncbi:MAG: hypothetical protein U5J95_05920 [Balneolaceae bacterium]|nr:hypothetical protein [Balneolaceae bacterium]